MKLRLATRGSKLALTQSGWVAEQLSAAVPGLEVELVTVKTSGDILPVEKWEAEGNKGLFVKEIEEALLAGRADLAVHSAKDLPAELPPGLVIGAYPEREDPRDVLVSRTDTLETLAPGAIVASASQRRRMQLALARPDLRYAPIRGNVDTRLRKLAEGECQALVLAAAGMKRLGILGPKGADHRLEIATEVVRFSGQLLDPSVVVPAPGQGALAVEARAGARDILDVLSRLDQAATRAAVECERAFMAAMGGGCRMPLGAFARTQDGELRLSVYYAPRPDAPGARLTGTRRAAEGRALALELAAKMKSAVLP